MNDHDPLETPRPSIIRPTVVTALVAAVLFSVPSVARGIDPGVSCCWNCGSGIMVWLLGALPAWLLWRQGQSFGGGHGFAAAFFGVGCGSGLGVILQMVSPGMDKAGLREWTGELTKRLVEESQRQGRPLPVPEAELRDTLEVMCLAAPIPMALVGTVIAGFVGAFTLTLLSRRQPPGRPVNPWSGPQA